LYVLLWQLHEVINEWKEKQVSEREGEGRRGEERGEGM
jgi:hypothetical protein